MAAEAVVLSEKFLQRMYGDAIRLYAQGVMFPLTEFYKIAANLGPKPTPEDCCGLCKGSGTIEHKKHPTYLSQYGNVIQDYHNWEYSTSVCARCGGRGFLMPWQKKKEQPVGASADPA